LNPVAETQDANAAVALLLRHLDQNLKVFLVKRVENPIDPWSGQMALPGGKRDKKDKNLVNTIIRETYEETNINLQDGVFLGVMEPYRSRKRPEMKILPFVILLKYDPLVELNEELEWFAWIPLEELIQRRGTVKLDMGEFPAYIFDSGVIWGLTYRILEKLISLILHE